MKPKAFMKKCKSTLRLLDNYEISDEIKFERISSYFKQVIAYEYEHLKILDVKLESVFGVLCKDIIRQCTAFLKSSNRTFEEARNLLNLILSIEKYLFAVDKLPWKIGRKISFREKLNIKRIFRKKLNSLYDEKRKRPVRGTRVKVELTGSLAKGYSDWKLINGGNILKPSDYEIPREYRKTKSLYKKLDDQLNLPQELKPLMADVDILILNEVIYDSINLGYLFTPWSFKLGEKYPTGVGASKILQKVHKSLKGTRIGGIRGRWVNYIVLRDDSGYARYKENRAQVIAEMAARIDKKISVRDVLIIDEVIR